MVKKLKKENSEQGRNFALEEKKRELEDQYPLEKEKWEKPSNLAEQLLGVELPPFLSKDEFVTKGLEEWERNQSKTVSGKYQDQVKTNSIYQKKFVEFTRDLCPKVIEELKEFVPDFDKVFGQEKERYAWVIDAQSNELNNLNETLSLYLNNITNSNCILQFETKSYKTFKGHYEWGKFHLLFQFLYLLVVEQVESDEVRQKTAEKLKEYLSFRENRFFSEDQTKEDSQKKYILKVSSNIIEDFLTNYKSSFLSNAGQNLSVFLENVTNGKKIDLAAFITLQLGLLDWAERHRLKKDWLLRYGYYFLMQFSNSPNLEVSKLEVGYLPTRSFLPITFTFNFEGWLPGDEQKEVYEQRLKASFKDELENYFQRIRRQNNLDNQPRHKRPPTFENVKWLVHSLLRNQDAEKVVEKFFHNISADRTKNESSALTFDNKVKHIKSEIRSLAKFNLPIPEWL